MSTGYSGTPLLRKLGIQPWHLLIVINPPSYYGQLIQVPRNQFLSGNEKKKVDFIHCFVRSSNELRKVLPTSKKQIKQDGMIWVSWYKKSSGMPTDVTEDVIRESALRMGLVDVKVCAIDEIWSGLKLVIPLEKRKPV